MAWRLQGDEHTGIPHAPFDRMRATMKRSTISHNVSGPKTCNPTIYPLDERSQSVWEEIDSLTQSILERLESKQYMLDVTSGCQPPEFETSTLGELYRIAAEHWPVIERTVPEEFTDRFDIRNRSWWDAVLRDHDESQHASSRARWIFLGSLHNAARHVLARDSAARLGRSGENQDPDRQSALMTFVRCTIHRRDAMLDLLRDTSPGSRVRYLMQQDVSPRYPDDVTSSRLNRAISASRANGDLSILGPRLEAAQKALETLASVLPEYPRGNIMPAEVEPLNIAVSALFPYLDSSDAATRGELRSATITEDVDSYVLARFGSSYYVSGFGEQGLVSRLVGFNYIQQLILKPGKHVPMQVLSAIPQ